MCFLFLFMNYFILLHVVTCRIYGQEVTYFAANAVGQGDNLDISTLASFHRIMVAGGSASIVNVIVGMILFFIVLKVSMGPTMRIFLTQWMGMHMCMGFGYMMIGGFFRGFGDWGQVCQYFEPGSVVVMRIILATVGSIGSVFTFFALNYMSYYFIEDPGNRKERFHVALRLHLIPFFVSSIFGVIVDLNSKLIREGYADANPGFLITCRFMLLGFFWAFFFTWVMVKPPKQTRFLYFLTREPKFIM